MHEYSYSDLPVAVSHQAKICLIDLVSVAAAGFHTPFSKIVRDHAAHFFAAGSDAPAARILFDGRRVSPVGGALAGSAMIESFDAHDGHAGAMGLQLLQDHNVSVKDIERIEVATFREASQLTVRIPETTEMAQYSLIFPLALALVYGIINSRHIVGDGLKDPEVLRLCQATTVTEEPDFNIDYPTEQKARVSFILRENGKTLSHTGAISGVSEPLTQQAVLEKYHSLAKPVLGRERSASLAALLAFEPFVEVDTSDLLELLLTSIQN